MSINQYFPEEYANLEKIIAIATFMLRSECESNGQEGAIGGFEDKSQHELEHEWQRVTHNLPSTVDGLVNKEILQVIFFFYKFLR